MGIIEDLERPMPASYTGGYPVVAATVIGGILTWMLQASRGDSGAAIGSTQDEYEYDQPPVQRNYMQPLPLPPPAPVMRPAPVERPVVVEKPCPAVVPRDYPPARGPPVTRLGKRNHDPNAASRRIYPKLYTYQRGEDPAVVAFKKNQNAAHKANLIRQELAAREAAR